MKKVTLFVLLLVVLTLSPVLAQTNSTNSESDVINKAYQCLQDKLEEKGTTLALEEAIFGTLALGSDTDRLEVIQDNEGNDCWPKSSCKLKETSQVLLAYDRIGRNTGDIEKYLLSKNGTTTDLDWFLVADIEQRTSATCSLRYDGVDHSFSINEDMKISGSPGGCFSIVSSGYWLQISDSCLSKKFEISCDGFSGNFITTLLYQKPNSDVIYVSPNTHSAPSSGTTTEEINAQCFKSGSSCDYEGTLWASLALQKSGYDVSSFVPYLFALSEDNKKFLPSSFLYTLSDSQEQYSLLVESQTPDGFWQAPNSANNKFFDTSLALLSLQGSSSAEEQEAKDYLARTTTTAGCWNNNNLRDTGFILYAGWPRFVSSGGTGGGNGTSGASCSSAGYYCGSFFECTDAQGQIYSELNCPSFGDICCSAPIGSKSCFELGGSVCSSGQQCSGSSASSLDGTCCIGTCQAAPDQLTTECAQNGGLCVSSCISGETQAAYSCESSSEVCCISGTGSSDKGSNTWLWIVLLLILVALVVLGIIYRNKLRLWIFKKKNSGGLKSSPASPRRPPFSPPMQRAPQRLPPRVQPRATPRVDKEMEETLRKLREMSK